MDSTVKMCLPAFLFNRKLLVQTSKSLTLHTSIDLDSRFQCSNTNGKSRDNTAKDVA